MTHNSKNGEDSIVTPGAKCEELNEIAMQAMSCYRLQAAVRRWVWQSVASHRMTKERVASLSAKLDHIMRDDIKDNGEH